MSLSIAFIGPNLSVSFFKIDDWSAVPVAATLTPLDIACTSNICTGSDVVAWILILLARHPDEVGLADGALDGAGVAPVVVVVVPTVVVVVATEVVVVVVVDTGCFVGGLVLSPTPEGLLVGSETISLVGAGVGSLVQRTMHVPF